MKREVEIPEGHVQRFRVSVIDQSGWSFMEAENFSTRQEAEKETQLHELPSWGTKWEIEVYVRQAEIPGEEFEAKMWQRLQKIDGN